MTPGVLDGSLLGLSHPVLDFGESLLDGVEIGRVWRQEPEPGSGGPDHLPDFGRLMRSEIVHDDDIAGLEHRHEQLLNIGTETLAVDRPVEDARRRQPVAAQRADEGQGAPVTVRRKTAQALAFRSPAAERGHVGLDPGLIDEDQPLRVETSLPRAPSPPPTGDVGAGLLKAEQRFFEAQPLAAKEQPHRIVRDLHPRARPTRPSGHVMSGETSG